MRRRPAAFVCLLLLSMLAVAVSVLAPTVLRSTQQTALAEAARNGGIQATSVFAAATSTPGAIETSLGAAVGTTTALDVSGLWRPAVVAVESDDEYPWRAGTTAPTRADNDGSLGFVGVGSTCADVPLVTGRCATKPGETVVAKSATSGRFLGVPALREGDTVRSAVEGGVVALTIVGVYDDARGGGRVLAGPAGVAGQDGGGRDPALVVSYAQLDDLNVAATAWSVRSLQRLPRLGDVPALRSDVAEAKQSVLDTEGAQNEARVTTGLLGVIDRVEPQNDAATIVLALVALEVLVLGWFAVGLAVQRIARARGAEWGLARLRGLPASRWLGSVFLEPAIALVAGGLLGFAVGVGGAFAAVRVVLGGTSSFEPLRAPVVILAAVCLTGSLVALIAASIRSSRLPLAALLGETTEPRLVSRLSLVAQSVIVVVAALVVASFESESEGAAEGRITQPGITLLVPLLLAVVLGLVAVRLAIVVIRRTARGAPRSLAGLVVGRQLGRAPSVLYAAVLVSLGVAVAAFATQDAVVALRLQDQRAAAVVGASRVLEVQVPQTKSLVDVVRGADPSGRAAMAAEVYASGTGVGRIVAVDTSRLDAVSSWSSSWSGLTAAQLRARLAPPQGRSLALRGTRLTIGLAGVKSGKIATDLSSLHLTAVVQADDGWHTINFGEPRNGKLTSAADAFPCRSGCRLVWLGAASGAAAAPPFSTEITITSIATDRQSASSLASWLDPQRWRNRVGDQTDPRQEAVATLASTAGGLDVLFTDGRGSNVVSIAPRDAPEPFPALLGDKTAAPPFPGVRHAVSGIGLDLSPRLLEVLGRVPALPRVLDEGSMVDLTLVQRVTDSSESSAQDEVWLAPGSHPAVLKALTRAGVVVTGTRSLSKTAGTFVREAPARAALMGLPIALGALAIALIGAVAVRLIGARGRQRDWESLRVAGVGTARLRRLIAVESFVPPAAGILLGLVSGTVTFVVLVPRLPLLEGDGAVPPPDWSLSILPLVALGLGSLVLCAGLAVVGARLELVRRSRP